MGHAAHDLQGLVQVARLDHHEPADHFPGFMNGPSVVVILPSAPAGHLPHMNGEEAQVTSRIKFGGMRPDFGQGGIEFGAAVENLLGVEIDQAMELR